MTTQRAILVRNITALAVNWWYTLAHEDTAPTQLAVPATELAAFGETLAGRGQVAPAALVARIAREVAHAEAELRARNPYGVAESAAGPGGERYVWAFRRLGDALEAVRATRRSDYHRYPQPRSLREASLDRLYQRFPLVDFPRVSALLFTGMSVCDDPRIGPDPHADALVAEVPTALAPDTWQRYTVCGFRQGIALVRVSATARWLRIGARALEDAWADARSDPSESSERVGEERHLRVAEERAREALLRIAPADAPQRPYEVVGILSPTPDPDEPAPLRTRRPRRASGKRLAYGAGQRAV